MLGFEKKEAARSGAAMNNISSNYTHDINIAIDNPAINYRLEDECLRHMRSNGVPLERPLFLDGKIRRFSIDHNSSKKDEWYCALYWEFNRKSYLKCYYGSWSSGEKFIFQSWKDDDATFSVHDREEAAKYAKEMERVADEERKERQVDAAKEAELIWESSFEEPQTEKHAAYLGLKKIKGYNARFGSYFSERQENDCIILPLLNIKEEIRSLQFIWVKDGRSQKRFLAGGEKKGCFFILGEIKDSEFYVSEGFATAASIHEATGKAVVIAFDCGNLDSVLSELRKKYTKHRIVIIADDDVDNPINLGRKKAVVAGEKYHCNVLFPKFPEGYKFPNGKSPSDFNDIHFHFGIEEVKKQLLRKTYLNPINIADILSRDIPPKRLILKPWLREKDLVMIYALRGLGKTWLALSIAYAIASGSKVLKFEAAEARRVLYVDGEMPSVTIKERLAKITLSSNARIQNPNFLRIINHDLEENSIRDLGTRKGQEDINDLIDEFDVLILDNLSCLLRSGDENEAGSWVIVQEWLLHLRKMGKTVIIIHHAGKNGQQRGTSKREDVLDTIIVLNKPKDSCASDGARFEIHFEKNRGFAGEDAKPFEVHLVNDSKGNGKWLYKDLHGGKKEEGINLFKEGMSITDIARELDVNKSTVSRWMKG